MIWRSTVLPLSLLLVVILGEINTVSCLLAAHNERTVNRNRPISALARQEIEDSWIEAFVSKFADKSNLVAPSDLHAALYGNVSSVCSHLEWWNGTQPRHERREIVEVLRYDARIRRRLLDWYSAQLKSRDNAATTQVLQAVRRQALDGASPHRISRQSIHVYHSVECVPNVPDRVPQCVVVEQLFKRFAGGKDIVGKPFRFLSAGRPREGIEQVLDPLAVSCKLGGDAEIPMGVLDLCYFKRYDSHNRASVTYGPPPLESVLQVSPQTSRRLNTVQQWGKRLAGTAFFAAASLWLIGTIGGEPPQWIESDETLRSKKGRKPEKPQRGSLRAKKSRRKPLRKTLLRKKKLSILRSYRQSQSVKRARNQKKQYAPLLRMAARANAPASAWHLENDLCSPDSLMQSSIYSKFSEALDPSLHKNKVFTIRKKSKSQSELKRLRIHVKRQVRRASESWSKLVSESHSENIDDNDDLYDSVYTYDDNLNWRRRIRMQSAPPTEHPSYKKISGKKAR